MSTVAEIPLGARVFDALTSDQLCRDAVGLEEAMKEVQALTGTHLDPKVVAAFVSIPNEELERIAYQAAAMQRVGNIP